MASNRRFARPGHENVTSVRTAPPSREAKVKPRTVMTGIRAFFSAWEKRILFSGMPLALAAST